MGGTFDPIHHGHLVAASEVATLYHLDEVIFVPTGEPWQKSERQVSPAEHRYLMAVIATASNPRFWVSRVDIDRAGPTYTIDTIRDIAAQRPGRGAVLHHRRRCPGADPVLEGRRGGAAAGALRRRHPPRIRAVRRAPARAIRCTLLDVPAMAISSSDCRAARRRRSSGLVPRAGRRRAVHQQAPPVPHGSIEPGLTVRQYCGPYARNQ